VRSKYWAVLFVALLNCQLYSQFFTISGFVKDSTSGESLKGAIVKSTQNNQTAVTNNYGFYSLSLTAGTHTIQIYIGDYEPQTRNFVLNKDLEWNAFLYPEPDAIGEVSVRAKRNDNVRKVDISTQSITGKVIKKIPAFLGEADVIKSIQLLPGVSTVGEGATGFNVRGGSIDQNLVLMDDAPVFNSAHLFGLFSIFNPDAVKDVQLIKGGIPANYGGRLSSVLDVITKDGNNRDFQVNGGVGTIFSRLTLEGPIVKNKASFLVSARRSYVDFLAKPFLNDDLSGSQFYFYDFTAKVNYETKKNKFFISSYIGDDLFYAANAFGVKWGNSTLSARWNHLFNDKLFSNVTYYYSRYRYNLEFNIGDDLGFNWSSFINNHSVKTDFKYYASPKHEIGFGGASTYYIFEPGNAVARNSLGTNNFSLPNKYSIENALYLTEDWSPNNKWTVRAGIRGSQFFYLGKSNVYYYKDARIEGQRRFIDSVGVAGDNEVIQQYLNLEPRLGFKYQWNTQASIKASTNNIKPELVDQYTIGYFRNFELGQTEFESSAEIYYKDLYNQVDYVDGANLLLNELLEGELINGIGRAYGLELYVKKATGTLTGWVSYTLSRSERKSPGINDNEWYANRFDRLHNLYIVAQYKYNEKWDFAANFVFSSGTPTTFYTGQYTVQGYNVPDAGTNDRNNVRNPDYHRLDLSATYTKRKSKKWESSWVFSIYNTYNRRNPFSIYFQNNYENTGLNQAIRFSVIGSIVPAISYNFKWN